MGIKITVDGKVYNGVDTITVGGKVLTLAYVADSTGGNTGGNTGGDNTGGNVPNGDALPTNGLLSYFDLRNLGNKANVTIGTTKGVTATQGSGALYSWASTPIASSDEHGAVLPRALLYSSDGSANQTDMGAEYSVCLMVHGAAPALAVANNSNHTKKSNVTGSAIACPVYNTSSGTSNAPDQDMGTNSKGYTTCVMTVSGNLLKMYFNGQLKATYAGTDYTDFKSWASTVGCDTVYSGGHTTAYAVYNRALTEAEAVEAMVFMSTLEVA